MKIHRVVQMLGATTSTGKLADDMYALGHKDYYSEAEDRYIPISHMDFQHMVRAFVKQNDDLLFWDDTQEGKSAELVTQNQDLVNANKNLGNRINVILKENEEVHLETQRLVQQLEHDEHQVGKCEELTKENAELKFQIEQVDRNQTVSKEAYDIAWQNMELWKKRYESQLPTPILGDVKMFSEIPNDPDGGSFVYLLRKYLNNVSYKIRVRGQYLDEQTKKTEGWRKYERGQPLEKSKCFRVYIDVKKEID